MTGRRVYRLYSGMVVLAIILELIWIGGAAMFGVASHFNVANPLLQAIYPLMGAFAVLLTSATLVYGIAIWRNRRTGLPPALHLSISLGLVLTFVLTLVVAGTLASRSGHLIGVPVSGATVPILGWSREVGDLRVSHFFATHALHFLPVAALLARAFAAAASGNACRLDRGDPVYGSCGGKLLPAPLPGCRSSQNSERAPHRPRNRPQSLQSGGCSAIAAPSVQTPFGGNADEAPRIFQRRRRLMFFWDRCKPMPQKQPQIRTSKGIAMSNQAYELKAEARAQVGKGSARELRPQRFDSRCHLW